ncbi:ABC transporter ATP-binding protein [Rhodobacteraceae bacterium KMM 6894]|nr:ABC transporter ATP-binding protein [Rhodobacteraceae bacterium KMM 6894]
MIHLENLSKSFWRDGVQTVVADNLNFTFPSGVSLALLGRNGAGKSTLLSMIAGTVTPDSGHIWSDGTISWPVGFKGSFHRDLTGLQNTRFVARVYGVDTGMLSAFVEDFSELGVHYHMPLRTYSSGMRSRLSFAVSMGIHFDTYLVDEVTSVGDAAFKVKSHKVFRQRIGNSGAIVVSHSMPNLRRLCTAGVVLEHGQLTYFDKINDAIDQHEANMGASVDY